MKCYAIATTRLLSQQSIYKQAFSAQNKLAILLSIKLFKIDPEPNIVAGMISPFMYGHVGAALAAFSPAINAP